jgi:hypothetical protein
MRVLYLKDGKWHREDTTGVFPAGVVLNPGMAVIRGVETDCLPSEEDVRWLWEETSARHLERLLRSLRLAEAGFATPSDPLCEWVPR